MLLKFIFLQLALVCYVGVNAQYLSTAFEKSNGKETVTYQDCITFYQKLAKHCSNIKMLTMGQTDAGYPLHLILYSTDKKFTPAKWNRNQKIVVLVNNGIHPGEPDGIDASMMLLRELAKGKYKIPQNIILAVIPVYNIGGALNRNNHSRVNQDGPASYGFRGNAQNLDLNRDFTKCDSRNAQSFAKLFHYLDPNILIDNHVSDGADYQYTMTLLATQYDKLGGATGNFLRKTLDPAVYKTMAEKKILLIPYVNVEDTPGNGWHAFSDPPRFSSGYAALFQCIAYVPETHMLKPFKQRVEATYALLQTAITECSIHSKEIIDVRKKDRSELLNQKQLALQWRIDTTRFTMYPFKGYAAKYKTSAITGHQRLYYDRAQPYEKDIPVYDYFLPDNFVETPKAYVISKGWHAVIDLLKLNNVQMLQLKNDSVLDVSAYHIDDYQTLNRAYEKHYKHHNIKASKFSQKITMLKGDYIIPVRQRAKRFIVEMLEPEGEDSYFAWNFFDAVLQQKEGYSDYRWEDVAEKYLQEHPEILNMLNAKKQADTAFERNVSAQLDFVYHHSPYYESAHLRYPVYRIE